MPQCLGGGGGVITCLSGKRQDTLERFYLSTGLGTLWETAGGRGWGEERLGFLAKSVPPCHPNMDKTDRLGKKLLDQRIHRIHFEEIWGGGLKQTYHRLSQRKIINGVSAIARQTSAVLG